MWEFVAQHPEVSRLAVPGGWLYHIYRNGVALTFVPDPNDNELMDQTLRNMKRAKGEKVTDNRELITLLCAAADMLTKPSYVTDGEADMAHDLRKAAIKLEEQS